MRLTRVETVAEFTNIEPTASANSEDRISLFPEVKEFALLRISITEHSSISVRIKKRSTGSITFITSLYMSVF